MKNTNPQVVQVPDGRIGCLTHRQGLRGCVEFGKRRILETYPLTHLMFVDMTVPAPRLGRT